MDPIRVLLADDHSIVRTGIRTILNGLTGVEVVGEAQDGREALEWIAKTRPDVVFMDIGMKNLNGLETTSRVTADFPGVRVVILSAHARSRDCVTISSDTVALRKRTRRHGPTSRMTRICSSGFCWPTLIGSANAVRHRERA